MDLPAWWKNQEWKSFGKSSWNMLLATYDNRPTSTVVSLEFCVSVLTQVRLRCPSLYTVIRRKENNCCHVKTLLVLSSGYHHIRYTYNVLGPILGVISHCWWLQHIFFAYRKPVELYTIICCYSLAKRSEHVARKGRGEVRTGFRWGNTREDHLEEVDVDGKIILKKWDGEAWTGLIWLRIETGGERLWMR
jgi:hypothetical protein